MPRKIRELRRDLRRTGWEIALQKGSHQQWLHPLVRDLRVTVSGADGKDAQEYQEEEVREAVARAKAARQAQDQQRKQKGQQP
jgi:predicted RNA binding protein YcfA (HicA-like mRNA interferase family)